MNQVSNEDLYAAGLAKRCEGRTILDKWAEECVAKMPKRQIQSSLDGLFLLTSHGGVYPTR